MNHKRRTIGTWDTLPKAGQKDFPCRRDCLLFLPSANTTHNPFSKSTLQCNIHCFSNPTCLCFNDLQAYTAKISHAFRKDNLFHTLTLMLSESNCWKHHLGYNEERLLLIHVSNNSIRKKQRWAGTTWRPDYSLLIYHLEALSGEHILDSITYI